MLLILPFILFAIVHSAHVRPLSSTSYEAASHYFYFTTKTVANVRSYGAKGDGKTDDTLSLQKAFNFCESNSAAGCAVVFDAGTYLSSALISNASNLIVWLGPGSTILGQLPGGWPIKDKTRGALITIPKPQHEQKRAMNVAFGGGGTVDMQGHHWWPLHGHTPVPHTINAWATNFLVWNVTFLAGASHQLELATDFTEIDKIHMDTPHQGTNTDGIDVHGTPFYVHDSYISVGDDHVAIHANDTLVNNCEFGTGHGCSIGSLGGHVNLRNITCSNIKINGAGGGIHIKSWVGATGILTDVLYENITFTNVGNGINIEMNYMNHTWGPTTFEIRNLKLKNIKGSCKDAGEFTCAPSSPCKDITLEDIDLQPSFFGHDFTCENAYGNSNNVKPPSCLK